MKLTTKTPTADARTGSQSDVKGTICTSVASVILLSELLLQGRPRRGPAELSVVLRWPIGVAIFVAGAVRAVVDVRDVVDAEGLVGEFMNRRPSDAASDPGDDVLARRGRRRVLDRVVREHEEPDRAPAAERAKDVRLAGGGKRKLERRVASHPADDRDSPEGVLIFGHVDSKIGKRPLDLRSRQLPDRRDLLRSQRPAELRGVIH